MSKNFGTIFGKHILSTNANQVTVGNNTFNLSNSELVENIYVNFSPIEYSNQKVFKTPQVGGVEIRNGDELLSKNNILDENLTLEKNAKEYQGATVYQNDFPVGMIQKGGSFLSTSFISSLVLAGCGAGSIFQTPSEKVEESVELAEDKKECRKHWWEAGIDDEDPAEDNGQDDDEQEDDEQKDDEDPDQKYASEPEPETEPETEELFGSSNDDNDDDDDDDNNNEDVSHSEEEEESQDHPEEETLVAVDPLHHEKEDIKNQCKHAELIATNLEEQMKQNKKHICAHQKKRMEVKMKQASNHFLIMLNKQIKMKEEEMYGKLTQGPLPHLMHTTRGLKLQTGQGENNIVKSVLLLAAASALSGCGALQQSALDKINLKNDSKKDFSSVPKKVDMFEHVGRHLDKQNEKNHQQHNQNIEDLEAKHQDLVAAEHHYIDAMAYWQMHDMNARVQHELVCHKKKLLEQAHVELCRAQEEIEKGYESTMQACELELVEDN